MRERLWRCAITTLAVGWFCAGRCLAQAPDLAPGDVPPAGEAAPAVPAEAESVVPDLPGPPPIPEVQLGPT